jgi:hypothetical protein
LKNISKVQAILITCVSTVKAVSHEVNLLADYNLASRRIRGEPIYWKGIKHYKLHGKVCTEGMAYIYFTNEVTNALGKRYAFMWSVRLHVSLR